STGWTYVAAGGTSTCGIQNDQLLCWGNDGITHSVTPTRRALPGGATPTRVDVGTGGICAFDASGNAYCWGDALLGLASVPTQLAITGSTGFVMVQIRYASACAIDTAGALRCWGVNDAMQLGVASPSGNVQLPASAQIPGVFVALAHEAFGSCAIDQQHQLT